MMNTKALLAEVKRLRAQLAAAVELAEIYHQYGETEFGDRWWPGYDVDTSERIDALSRIIGGT